MARNSHGKSNVNYI